MRNIIILFIAVSLFSCNTKKLVKMEINKERSEFILSYKKSILYGCIEEATNNNFHTFIKENNDLGISIEVEIAKFDVIEIINLGKKMAKNIRTINYSDYEGRKPIFSDCISFAFSKETDSMARIKHKQYKLYKKKGE